MRMKAASFSTRRMNSASDSMSVILSIKGGIALPPMPMRVQSIKSPSSRNVTRPTTMPLSDATTCSDVRVAPSVAATSSSTTSDSFWSRKSFTSV
jgi:hypothetical protein